MQLIMVRWGGFLGAEQCWVVPWTPNEDFVCITSHAQSTAATSFTCAVKSDGVHLTMVCWVPPPQSFGAEQIGDTWWPTNIFAHACVEVKFMSIPFSCIPSRNKAGGGFGDEQCWVVLWTPIEDFGCITSHAQSTAATYFTGAVKSDVVHLIMVCWVLLLQSFGAEQIGYAYLLMLA